MSADLLACLERAKKLLVNKGWKQNGYRDWEGRRCAVGALVDSSTSSMLPRATLALIDALPDGSDCVATWNDAPGRTLGQVLALYDRAIEHAQLQAFVATERAKVKQAKEPTP